MFDWVSDAVSWIGDGIASAWNNVVISTVNDITDAVFDAMFQWTYGLIYGAIAEIFEFINSTSADIFSLAWVQAFIALFCRLGWMLFLCGLIVAVFDAAVAYESGQNTVKNTCLNVLKGFFAVNLVTVVPQRLYSFCTTLQGSFAHDLIASFVGASPGNIIEAALYVIGKLNETQALSSLIFIILFGYCTVKVVLANIKRGGILLCQIAVGSLYLFSVPRGFTDGFYSWCKQVIATCLTAFLQTTILYLGLLTYDSHPLLALGICMSANEVPRIAQMFGLDTSTHVNMVSVSSTVSMGTRAIKLLAKH
ncbi:MAG: hypothetical protein K2I93_04485 [Oscillospiraceae bacterium]|nr:hypothetical protein [Oscillospiraceae bacterium]